MERALAAARGGDTIFFPPGTYSISKQLETGAGVSIEGAGRDSVTLEFLNGSGVAGSALRVYGFPARMRNLTIRSRVTSGLPHETRLVRFDGRFQTPTPAGLSVENTACEVPAGQMYACMGTEFVNEVRFENNEFLAGSAILLTRSHQVLIRGNRFAGNWPDLEYSPLSAIGASVCAGVEITGNEAFSRNRAAGETLSRFYVAQGHSHGATYHHYVADNDLRQIGCARETCGENILIEAPGTLFAGPAASIEEAQLSFDGVDWRPQSMREDDPRTFENIDEHRPSIVAIQSGKGEGQYRRITANTERSLTIDRPWDVAPDRGSVFAIVTAAYRMAIFRNSISGWPEALDKPLRPERRNPELRLADRRRDCAQSRALHEPRHRDLFAGKHQLRACHRGLLVPRVRQQLPHLGRADRG